MYECPHPDCKGDPFVHDDIQKVEQHFSVHGNVHTLKALAARAGMPPAALERGAATARGAARNAVMPAGKDAEAPRTTAAEDYEKIVVAGEGTFGVVWKVRHRATGAVFAMKKMRFQARDHGVSAAAIDEISALQVRVSESWLCRFAPAQPM